MNKNPFEVLVAGRVDGKDGIEAKIKECHDMGKFELVGPVSVSRDGTSLTFCATMRNTEYVKKDPTG